MQGKFKILREKPYPLGCYIDYDKSLVVRAVYDDSKQCGVTLYSSDKSVSQPLVIRLPKEVKRGRIYSARISGIEDIDLYDSYNFFEGNSYFCDSYARHVIGLETFGKDVKVSDIRAKLENRAVIRANQSKFDWGKEVSPHIPYENSFVYLMNVRGFTQSPSSGVSSRKRGTFAGILEKLPYLKELGVTTLELMPVYEMNCVENSLKELGSGIYSKDGAIVDKASIKPKINFWGYKKGYYFAPRTSYCENPDDAENEFKSFVKTLHDNNIEVVLQFFFSENESESIILDALRFWRCNYHVDGFHLKGARIPVSLITREPLFDDVKIWHEWFDYGQLLSGARPAERLLSEYNNTFLYASRRFLKSDDNSAGDFLKAMTANATEHGIINYICNYEGFRLFDLVSYEHKHNEENGENNKDGSDNNLSWNCGIEGRTRKHSILELRKKQIKNILTMLFMAQGTPMIFSGDEFGNSQAGNNNPYCQDNEIGWVDWKALDRNQDIYDYVRFLVNFRFSHNILHSRYPFKLMDYESCGYPDLSCHGADAWRPDLSGYSHILGMLYCGLYDRDEKDKTFIYVCYNMHWMKADFALPKLPDGLRWTGISDTAGDCDGIPNNGGAFDNEKDTLNERSVRIYISEKDPNFKKKGKSKKKQNEKE